MVKPLDLTDFRAVRRVLEPDDFALPGVVGPRRDLIDAATWAALVGLPDDVAISTTNDYGSTLREVNTLQGIWTTLFEGMSQDPWAGVGQSPFGAVTLDVYDAFQGSTFNAVVGYYRLAFTALRAAVESMTVATMLELNRDAAGFRGWLEAGRDAVDFKEGADGLSSLLKTFENDLRQKTGTTMFGQKDRPTGAPEGHARAFFHELCCYTHAAPGFTDGDMWKSNGPVFSHQAFELWASSFFGTFALTVLLLRLGRSDFAAIPDERISSAQQLFGRAVQQVPAGARVRQALLAVPTRTWG